MDDATTFFVIQWFPPVDNGVPPFSRYDIYVLFPTGEEILYTRSSFNEATNNTARSFNITGLIPGTTYKVSMTAVSEAFGIEGESIRSRSFEFTTANAGWFSLGLKIFW